MKGLATDRRVGCPPKVQRDVPRQLVGTGEPGRSGVAWMTWSEALDYADEVRRVALLVLETRAAGIAPPPGTPARREA